MLGRLSAMTTVVALLLEVRSAGAQTPPEVREGNVSRAQKLFDEALTLADQQRWGEACPKFRESLAADPGVGTLLNVAACSAREGKVLDALREYRHALELNAVTADPERKRAVDAQARQGLTELAGRVGRVTVIVTPAAPNARVLIDGMAATAPGTPVDVVAGAHVVRVEAEGMGTAESNVTVVGGQELEVPVRLTSTRTATPSGSNPSAANGLTTAGWIMGLTGGGLLATGAVLLTLAADRASAIRDECGTAVSPPDCPSGSTDIANDLSSEGQSFAIGGYVSLGVGGAAIVGGVTMLLADLLSNREEPATPPVALLLGPGAGMLIARGSFQ